MLALPIETTPFILSATLLSILAVYSYRLKNVPGSKLFALALLSTIWWMLCYVMDVYSTTIDASTFWLQIKYLGAAPASFLWLAFTLEMTGHQRVLASRWFAFIWLWPAAIIAIVLTNSWHSLFWAEIWVTPESLESQVKHGPAFQFYALTPSILGVVTLALFAHHSFNTVPFYRRRNLLLVAGLLCPFAGYYLDIGSFLPFLARIDPVLFMQTPASLFLFLAIYRYKAMDILPLAQRLVFENIKSGVVVVDPRGEIVAMNTYARNRWPVPENSRVKIEDVIKGTRGKHLHDGAEFELMGEAGETFLVVVSDVGDSRAGVLGHALIFIDITARKAAEDAQAAAVVSRSQFLATVSHELRTPLHGIIGLIQLFYGTKVNTQQHNYLGRMDASSRMLMSLINNVLDHSRIESGEMLFEDVPFDLAAVMEQIRSVHSVTADERGVSLVVEADNLGTAISGDSLRLTQVLANLTSNAIKFTPSGTVSVNARVHSDTAEQIELEFIVEDEGIGIPQAQQDHLFDPFTQADSSMTRRFGGTGLGLTISQSLVHGMGGDIRVISEEGRGSTFSFRLKFAVSDAALSSPTLSSSEKMEHIPDFAGYKILVADDTAVNLEIVAAFLEGTQVEISLAPNGSEALALADNQHFDMFMFDIHMPLVDGYAATRSLRAQPRNNTAPIIAMTASVLSEDREQALAAGMTDFIAKPFSREALFEVMRKHLNTSATTQPLKPTETSGPDLLRYGVDTQTGSVFGNIGSARYHKLLLDLLTDASRAVSKMPNSSAASIQSLAHGVAGGASMLGATVIAEAALALEADSLNGASEQKLKDRILTLSNALEQLRRYPNLSSPST